jgi:uncharacterized membrane protein
MPFCSQCGNKVTNEDAYCAQCGSRQPNAPTAFPPGVFPNPYPKTVPPIQQVDFLERVPNRTFSILCYVPVIGWVPSVVVLGMKRFRGDFVMRFHAFQGLYIFAAWLIVDWAIQPIFSSLHHVLRVDSLLQLLLMFVWIFMLVKTSHGEIYELPLIGELAQRSARERP